ncbi:hypothetical protein NX059_006641 [Plenodomus lindquistii]|nr:hypothetical protein NX059_006641 [Plenodomus lindquistii]
MDTTQPPSTSHFSFTRFSEKIRDSTKRKHSHSHTHTANPSIDISTSTSNPATTKPTHKVSNSQSQSHSQHIHIYNKSSLSIPDPDALSLLSNSSDPNTTTQHLDPPRDRRRSSVANYTSHIRSLFTPSPSHSHSSRSHPPPPTLLTLPTELLNKILSFLPFYTLLHARSISVLFARLIPGSCPLLAEQLYLRPSRSLQIYAMVPATFELDMDVSTRSIEDGVQPPGVRISKGVRRDVTLTRKTMGLIRMSEEIVFHPVVVEFNSWIGKVWFRDSAVRGVGWGGVRESWRDMLVSMPPLREMRIRHARTRAVISLITVGEEEGEGITLGMVFDALGVWAVGKES